MLKHILLLYNDYALDSSFWALAQMQLQVEPVEEIKWGLEMSWQPYLSIFLLGVNNHLTADLFNRQYLIVKGLFRSLTDR